MDGLSISFIGLGVTIASAPLLIPRRIEYTFAAAIVANIGGIIAWCGVNFLLIEKGWI